jgi:hypothetical protein
LEKLEVSCRCCGSKQNRREMHQFGRFGSVLTRPPAVIIGLAA